MQVASFQVVLQEYRRLVEHRLHQVVQSRTPDTLYEPIRYVLNSGGKRIRPILVLLACEAVGGRAEQALDAAAATELLHNFTLVHDDIMDQDDTRRGLPTVHKKWDVDVALLAGDGLVSLAYQTLLATRSPRLAEIARVFTDGIVELCEGQALDCEFEKRADVSTEEYLEMIGKKTARLLNVATTMGALVGGGSDREVEVLGRFGYDLGCAFQIQDDLLDIMGDEAVLGKTQGSDVSRKKRTFLLVHALCHADTEAKKRLIRALNTSGDRQAQIQEMQALFAEIGSIAAAEAAIREYISSARASLAVLPESTGRASLSNLLHYVATRKA